MRDSEVRPFCFPNFICMLCNTVYKTTIKKYIYTLYHFIFCFHFTLSLSPFEQWFSVSVCVCVLFFVWGETTEERRERERERCGLPTRLRFYHLHCTTIRIAISLYSVGYLHCTIASHTKYIIIGVTCRVLPCVPCVPAAVAGPP